MEHQAEKASVIVATLYQSAKHLVKCHDEAHNILIDEAGQATEIDITVAILPNIQKGKTLSHDSRVR